MDTTKPLTQAVANPATVGMPADLTADQRAAVERLTMAPSVDLLLHCEPTGEWMASLVTPDGRQEARGAEIGEFLVSAAATWAP